jgi:hypothetical protein
VTKDIHSDSAHHDLEGTVKMEERSDWNLIGSLLIGRLGKIESWSLYTQRFSSIHELSSQESYAGKKSIRRIRDDAESLDARQFVSFGLL